MRSSRSSKGHKALFSLFPTDPGHNCAGHAPATVQVKETDMKQITITKPAEMDVTALTQYEIDEIRTALSNFKEECDGNDWEEEPGVDKEDWTEEDQEVHDRWSQRTWELFDDLPIDRLDEEGKLGELIEEIKKAVHPAAAKIGHIYEALQSMEEVTKER